MNGGVAFAAGSAVLFGRLLLRDGQVVFWNFGFFPFVLVLFLAFLSGDDASVRVAITAAMVTVTIMANALFSVSVGVAAARERGVYRLYAAARAPLGALVSVVSSHARCWLRPPPRWS